jgi:hypothetical protein
VKKTKSPKRRKSSKFRKAGKSRSRSRSPNPYEYKKSSKGKKKRRSGKKQPSDWALAVKAARSQLGIKGFVPVGGKSAKGKQLLATVRQIRGTKKRNNK